MIIGLAARGSLPRTSGGKLKAASPASLNRSCPGTNRSYSPSITIQIPGDFPFMLRLSYFAQFKPQLEKVHLVSQTGKSHKM